MAKGFSPCKQVIVVPSFPVFSLTKVWHETAELKDPNRQDPFDSCTLPSLMILFLSWKIDQTSDQRN